MVTVGGITFRTQEELRTQKLEGKNRTNVILDDKTIDLLKELASIYNTSASEIMRTLLCNFAIEQKKEINAMKTAEGCRQQIKNNIKHLLFHLRNVEETLDSKIYVIIKDATDECNEYDSFVHERAFIVSLKKMAKKILALLEVDSKDCQDKIGEQLASIADNNIDNKNLINLWSEIGDDDQKEVIKCLNSAIDYHNAWSEL